MRAVADQRYVMLLMSGLITLAWALLWIGGQSPYGRYLSHEDLRVTDLANGFVTLAVMTGWLFMIIAMMLPTSLPLVGMFARMTRQRPDRVSFMLTKLPARGEVGDLWFRCIRHIKCKNPRHDGFRAAFGDRGRALGYSVHLVQGRHALPPMSASQACIPPPFSPTHGVLHSTLSRDALRGSL